MLKAQGNAENAGVLVFGLTQKQQVAGLGSRSNGCCCCVGASAAVAYCACAVGWCCIVT